MDRHINYIYWLCNYIDVTPSSHLKNKILQLRCSLKKKKKINHDADAC